METSKLKAQYELLLTTNSIYYHNPCFIFNTSEGDFSYTLLKCHKRSVFRSLISRLRPSTELNLVGYHHIGFVILKCSALHGKVLLFMHNCLIIQKVKYNKYFNAGSKSICYQQGSSFIAHGFRLESFLLLSTLFSGEYYHNCR